MMKCPRCGGPGVLLLTSIACDRCDRPARPEVPGSSRELTITCAVHDTLFTIFYSASTLYPVEYVFANVDFGLSADWWSGDFYFDHTKVPQIYGHHLCAFRVDTQRMDLLGIRDGGDFFAHLTAALNPGRAAACRLLGWVE